MPLSVSICLLLCPKILVKTMHMIKAQTDPVKWLRETPLWPTLHVIMSSLKLHYVILVLNGKKRYPWIHADATLLTSS